MTLINDVTDTWNAYLRAMREGNKAALAEEREELIYDVRNFAFAKGKLSPAAFKELLRTEMEVAQLSDTAIEITLPDGEVVEIQARR